MLKHRYLSIFLVAAIILLGYFVYATQNPTSKYAFKLGLDLNGGTQLTYVADTTQIKGGDIAGAMSSLRDVIERRINIFGVSEPVIQVETGSAIGGTSGVNRLVVDLPGVTDVKEAEAVIGVTPHLDFRLVRPEVKGLTTEQLQAMTIDQIYAPTGLDGSMLESAALQFTQGGQNGLAGKPIVALQFNGDGTSLFSKITGENKGQVLAIVLDGQVISAPTINVQITDGKAIIEGNFSAEEGKLLVQNLNYGALPVPITLESTQSIGPSLGANAQTQGVRAGIAGFLLVAIFLIVWYRLPGLVATVSLVLYVLLSLALFKLVPVTLTAAGIAGFILSIGLAVDANVLIFERLKEELKAGHSISEAMHLGFSRAWLSIRDSNISSLITSIVLFWLGTAAIKGFALTLGLGVLVSMFTAITVSRTFLFAVAPEGKDSSSSRFKRFLFSNGFHF